MNPFGSLHSENMELLEQYRQLWEADPTQLDASWRAFFSQQPAQKPVADDNSLYRMFGHLEANTYPAGLHTKPTLASIGNDPLMRAIYCGSVGYEFYPHCPQEICDYIIRKIEPIQGKITLSREEKQNILHLLNKAESFETFLHTKYVGQKRFSLEGAETLIPVLATFLDADLDDLVIGMPHRGRLNVLVNILQKSYDEIFSEFEDVATDTFEASGDVKYHKGYNSKLKEMNIRLAANPSHLESVDAVVEGIARARQTDKSVTKVLPVLVHGDAAVSGQGVVYETLQMAKLAGYTTGGTIHIVINNHIGFTTLPKDGRSTQYCTDIARTFGIPVFHVNAEDPESCLFVTKLALEIRQKFGSDVFIDMNCWRKYGHNESDEPAFTQPITYQTIRKKPSIRTQYHDKLVKEGFELALLDLEFKNELQEAHTIVRGYAEKAKANLQLRKAEESVLFATHDTGVDKTKIEQVVAALTSAPQGFTLHPRLLSQIEARKKSDLQHVDWAFAEALAFGTLLQEHVPIRLAGQDSRRGTFSQRHGVWFDQVTGASYTPHTTIDPHFEIVDSYLSEYAALAFEYGYSIARPEALVLWEAQFGDFANGAQIVIDQYLSPAEQKWGVHSKLVMLLPHGYEGQGPEHSSARLERFLQLAAEDNMLICYPSNPAQYFHVLRRQVKMNKPLIVFTPKGLLRSPECVSSIDDLVEGTFVEVLDDTVNPANVTRLIFCSGSIYYDLKPHCKEDTALIRIEQLYPLHTKLLVQIIARYPQAKDFVWAQEEPYNMGARAYIFEPLKKLIPHTLQYCGRAASASPACGSHLVHEKEFEMIIDSLFRGQK